VKHILRRLLPVVKGVDKLNANAVKASLRQITRF
jgi:hypothetical protein